ncbi:trypsin-like serine peptidase [Loktanella sp. DJP18]|uniref:trypsin-like serine peptidase n=1 Tax=Loktanella sp. DJP18 TaxID=3409788 RepID=UPI003BB638EE
MGKVRSSVSKALFAILTASTLSAYAQVDEAPSLHLATVGHVTTSGYGNCGFVAIGADLVMTAAHCVVLSGATEPVDPSRVTVSVHAYDKPVQEIAVKDIATNPAFHYDIDPTRETVGHDVALLRLSAPIDGTFEAVFAAPEDLTFVGLLPIVEGAETFQPDACPVKVEAGNVLVLDCARIPGTSGSPVFAMVEGKRRVIGVISAGGKRDNGQEITFGTNAAAAFEGLTWLIKDRGAVGKF